VPPSDPPCDCECPCCQASESPYPVRYGTGEFRHEVQVIPPAGSGILWGHTRYWSNQLQIDGEPISEDNGLGWNWLIEQSPYVHVNSAGDEYTVALGMGRAVFFMFDGISTFTPKYSAGNKYTLTPSGNKLVFTEPNGNKWEFHDMNQLAKSGMFYRAVSPGGQTIEVITYHTIQTSGEMRVATVRRSFDDGTTNTVDLFEYLYETFGANEGRLQQVRLTRSINNGPVIFVRAENYTYYGTGDANGNPGDLKSAVIQRPSGTLWIDDETYYYRYYLDSAGGKGFQHGLKFIVQPEAFSRLAAAGKNPLTTSVSDADIARYADFYLEYDGVAQTQRVTKETVMANQQTYTFAYTDSSLPPDYNRWRRKTVMTRPDSATVTVFTNYVGQVIVKELKEGAKIWVDHFKFDTDGHNVLHAHPSGISIWTPPADPNSDLSVTLKSGVGTDVGYIEVIEYPTAADLTTFPAGETTPGHVAGHEKSRKIKNGDTGSATTITLREIKYIAHATDDGTVQGKVFPVGLEVVYPKEDGSGSYQTSYNYTWFDGPVAGDQKSSQIKQRVTTHPVVTTIQNGSNAPNLRTEQFNERGELIWIQDERGFITYNAYDSANGKLIQTVADVDSSELGFTSSPWVTPSGGGAHLVTDYTLDERGRVTMVKGPEHPALNNATSSTSNTVRSVTTTLYKDDSDEVRSAQGYWDQTAGNYTLYNPISITKLDQAGRVVEQIQATRGTGAPLSTPNDLTANEIFDRAAYVRWTKNLYNNKSQLRFTRVYHLIPGAGDGTHATNYAQTSYTYDKLGRQASVTTPGGTITLTTYDARGLPLSVSTGVNSGVHLLALDRSWQNQLNPYDVNNDGHVVSADALDIINYLNAFGAQQLPEPPNGNPSGPPPFYDVNGDGWVAADDSLEVTNYVNAFSSSKYPTLPLQVVRYEYDGAPTAPDTDGGGDGNLTKETRPVDAIAGNDRVTNYFYDWRNRRIVMDGEVDLYVEYTYDNLDRVTQTVRKNTPGSGFIISQEQTVYDNLGRVFQTVRYPVNISTGVVGSNKLTDNTWYDATGNVVKQQPAGSKAFTKTKYDGVGRPIKTFVGYDTTDTSYATALNTSGDMLFEQTENTFDAAGNVTLVTTRRRFHNATGTGELTTPGDTQPKARVTYVANWYDGISRFVGMANYGTNGGAAPTVPATVPAGSNVRLVTTFGFNARGEAETTAEPWGIDPTSPAIMLSAYDHAGRLVKTVQRVNKFNSALMNDQNVTVEYTYNADGRIATIKARQPIAANDQVTIYEYGVNTFGGSTINSRDLLAYVKYPDSVDPSDIVSYLYNRQGQIIQMKDQIGTVHTYDYDKLGRQLHDRITTLRTGVDNAVLRISTVYEVRGLVSKITSVNNASVGIGTVVNEVQNDYNDFGQLIAQHQAHGGAVVVGTTPKVSYAYATGSANQVRPTNLTYPSGRVLNYHYTGTDADNLSRVTAIVDSNGTTHLADYTYLGLGMVAKVDYAEVGVRMDLAFGTGSDPYDGLDRFDRVQEIPWTKYVAPTGDVARIKNGYEQAGLRYWREDPVAAASGKNFDESYSHEFMSRLQIFWRGDLDAAKTGIVSGTKTRDDMWGYDAVGNINWYREDSNGDGFPELIQSTRTHNKANEITAITQSVPAAPAPSWPVPTYDRNGNTITMPQPGNLTGTPFTATYDAWNRLVKLAVSGTTTVQYKYDGQNWRITTIVASPAETREHYYTSNWQLIEDRVGGSMDRQFVWGIRYIDDLVLRDRGAERKYALQDPNWNVVAVYDKTAAAVQERYVYTAYGTTQVLDPLFVTRTSSSYDWEFRYAGYKWDKTSGLLHVRNRDLHSPLGRWLTRDPMLYDAESMNLYVYASNSGLTRTDPTGAFAAAGAAVGGGIVIGGGLGAGGVAGGITLAGVGTVVGTAVAVVATAYGIWKLGCFAKFALCQAAAANASIYCGRSWFPNNTLSFKGQVLCIATHASIFITGCAIDLKKCLFSLTGGWIGGSDWYSPNAFKKSCVPCTPPPPPPPGLGPPTFPEFDPGSTAACTCPCR
jgi:RHS repeat-associated protein